MPFLSEAPAAETADALRAVAVNSAYTASRALSKWFKRGVRLTCDGFEAMPIHDVAAVAGSPEAPVVAVHMTLTGDVSGDVMLVFPEQVAMQLCDLMIEAPPGTTTRIGEMEASCLQETGNIVGSSFTNCLASWLKFSAIPASPTVVHDLACAVIQPVLVSHATTADEALLCKTEFDLDGQRLEWFLLLLPSVDSLKKITAQCACDEVHKNALHSIAINGAFAASRAMSKWLRRGVRLSTEGFVRLPLRNLCSQTEHDEPVVALHMQLIDQLHGHSLLVLPMASALELVRILTHAAPGATIELDEMALSCLQETGNIICSSFVNSWSKWLEIHTEPQPPQLRIDLLPAILESILVEQAMASDEVFIAKTSFGVNGQWLDWDFYLLPTPSSLRLIEASIN